MTSTRFLVAGLGNVLLGDDGIGPLVVLHLQARFDFDGCTTLLDLGTPGLNLQPYLSGLHGLVVVDALKAHGRPLGSVEVLDRERLLAHAPPPRVSPHDLGLKESVQLMELAEGRSLHMAMVGVAVNRTEQDAPISPAVSDSVGSAMEAVLEILDSWGAPRPQPKKTPTEVEPWWLYPRRTDSMP